MIQYNKIYNEDCLITMSNMEDNSIDLTLTSPPYDDLRTYNEHLTGNKTEFNGYSFPFEQIARELYRITKKVVLLFGLSETLQIKEVKQVHHLDKHCFSKNAGLIYMIP